MKRIQYKGDIAYYVRRDNGKVKWERLGHRDEEKTWRAYQLREAARDSAGAKTFSAVALRFQSDMLRPDTPFKRSPRTLAEYQRQLHENGRVMRVFADSWVSQIKPKHIAAYLDEHPAPISANREVSVISQVIQFAIREGLIDTNPCVGVRKMPENKRRRYLTDDEFLAVRECALPSVQIAMDVGYLTGLRLSDVLALRAENVRDEYLHAKEGKTRQKVRYQMSDALKEAIARSGLDIGPVVHTRQTKTSGVRAYTLTGFESVWRRAKLKAKLPDVRFHDIRAKHATDKDEAGLNAQLALGHTDRATTVRYIRHELGRIVQPLY